MKVRAISLWEPWASLMRAGYKHNETRSWATSHRGPLLICAAKTHAGLTKETEFAIPLLSTVGLNFGKAVALVNVVDCVKTEGACNPNTREYSLGNYTPGRYAWITEPMDVTFKPFPVKGQQGFFNVDVPEGTFKV